jgi:hypothetical protein
MPTSLDHPQVIERYPLYPYGEADGRRCDVTVFDDGYVAACVIRDEIPRHEFLRILEAHFPNARITRLQGAGRRWVADLQMIAGSDDATDPDEEIVLYPDDPSPAELDYHDAGASRQCSPAELDCSPVASLKTGTGIDVAFATSGRWHSPALHHRLSRHNESIVVRRYTPKGERT